MTAAHRFLRTVGVRAGILAFSGAVRWNALVSTQPLSPQILFSDAPPDGTLVVELPAGITRKRSLLGIVSRELFFPDYFGWNWDAFEECLRDLHWLDRPASIVLRHADLPFANDDALRKTYLDIVSGAADTWDCAGPHRLIAQFPTTARADVLAAWDELSSEKSRRNGVGDA